MKKLFRALSLCLTLALCVFCSTAPLAEAPAATPAPQDERVITDVSPVSYTHLSKPLLNTSAA